MYRFAMVTCRLEVGSKAKLLRIAAWADSLASAWSHSAALAGDVWATTVIPGKWQKRPCSSIFKCGDMTVARGLPPLERAGIAESVRWQRHSGGEV